MQSRFSKVINTDQGSLNFYFNRKKGNHSLSFLVSAVQKSGKAVIFEMEKLGKVFYLKSVNPLPHWVITLENELSEAIIESQL